MKPTEDIISRDKKCILATYAPHNIVFERGDGCRLYDTEGKEYLDFLAGIAVCALGYNNKKLVKAIKDQAAKLTVVSNYFYSQPRGELAERLLTRTHFSKVFFNNSGAEANETAFKIAKKFFNAQNKGRYKIVTCENSFHGRTIAAVTATGQEKYHKPFAPMPDWFIYVPYNDIGALKAALSDPAVGAFMAECIQGEGGVIPASEEYMAFARKETKRRDQLLIIDEVQTGIMRTGSMYGYRHYGIKPDIITLAKALGGGFPIGACLITERLAEVMRVGDHGTTFGASPLACQTALTVIKEVTKPKMQAHIKDVSEYLLGKLKAFSGIAAVADIRGRGLMLGMEFTHAVKAKDVVEKLLQRGVVASAAGNNTLRLVPPLIISKDEIDKMCLILDGVLKECN